MDDFISGLMGRMTIAEKIGQLNMVGPGGDVKTGIAVNTDIEGKIRRGQVGAILNVPSHPNAAAAIYDIQSMAVNESRLGIPLMFWLDIVHGHKTVFPIGMSHSWDMALIEKAAQIQAIEGSADGYHGTFSPMGDVVRDPRWGRVAEILVEDPYLAGEVVAAQVRGYQGDDLGKPGTLMSCVKHFAAYGAAEGGMEYNSVDMSLMKLHEVYLRPYRAGIQAGAGALMAAFNDVNGVPCHANAYLLQDVLRKEWGFKGLTIGDYEGNKELIAHGLGDEKTVAALSLRAGLNMEMIGEVYHRAASAALEDNMISLEEIDQACRLVLEAKYKLGLFSDPYRGLDVKNSAQKMLLPEHRKIARDLAASSCVLLKNDHQVLPLKKSGTIALIGPLADDKLNMQGTWAVSADAENSVAVLAGMGDCGGPDLTILHAKGANITDDPVEAGRINVHGITAPIDKRSSKAMLAEAVKIARKADVIVVVLGEAKEHSGEASSRTDIGLPQSQKTLLAALQKLGKPLVLVLMSGRPLTIEQECAQADAVLQTWFGGTEAGNAIADILFGDVNPSGKLTMSFPRNVGQIPVYYNQRSTGRPTPEDEHVKFKAGYIDSRKSPLFPFGYGLSYTNFSYGPVQADKQTLKGEHDTLKATVTVRNTGACAGEEIVQLYIQDPVASITRPVKDLKAFQKISLQPGEEKSVRFDITAEDLKFYNPDLNYDWEPGEFILHVGPHSAATKTVSVQWEKQPGCAPRINPPGRMPT